MQTTHATREAARQRHDATRHDDTPTTRTPEQQRAAIRENIQWLRRGLEAGRLVRCDTVVLAVRAWRAQHTASIQDQRYG